MRSAIILGAGMAGVGTALHLQRLGWSVALVAQAPGRGTSYGNAGIIQNEAVEPYPMPRDRAALFAIRNGSEQRRARSVPPPRAAAALLVALRSEATRGHLEGVIQPYRGGRSGARATDRRGGRRDPGRRRGVPRHAPRL